MVKQDNRRELSARVEQLEQEVALLQQALSDKQEQERVMLEEKYEKAMTSVAEMEKRVLMAESMLEATLQYESGQAKAQSSPRSTRPPDSPHTGKKIGILSFGLGRRDKNKERSRNEEAPGGKQTNREEK
ncbi:hypothetical protein BVRB_7g180770 isoform B [Beta vulgaris subsp. vulgaris]|nr:hypothetical protein BVRB_7g180770 isoform B [Beta vulgaris subsp. vulgaris]